MHAQLAPGRYYLAFYYPGTGVDNVTITSPVDLNYTLLQQNSTTTVENTGALTVTIDSATCSYYGIDAPYVDYQLSLTGTASGSPGSDFQVLDNRYSTSCFGQDCDNEYMQCGSWTMTGGPHASRTRENRRRLHGARPRSSVAAPDRASRSTSTPTVTEGSLRASAQRARPAATTTTTRPAE